jgi:hypothetical protein
MQNQSKTQAQVQHQLQKLDNDTLLKRMKDLASEERKITLEILSHFREVNRRGWTNPKFDLLLIRRCWIN